MGKIRRKFEVEFKRRLVEQIETGQMTLSAAARQYQISPSVIQRWRTQYEANQLVDGLRAGNGRWRPRMNA